MVRGRNRPSTERDRVVVQMDWSRGQDVQLTVKTPVDGFRMTELTHSLTNSDSSVQWSGALTYGLGQRASSHLDLTYPDGRISSTFDLQTPFTSDLAASFDVQGDLFAHTRKTVSQFCGVNIRDRCFYLDWLLH